jgi:small subunit ribosomal protein S18
MPLLRGQNALHRLQGRQDARFFITERGKILPRRISGNRARHQREVNVAVQRCRNIALIPAGEK